MRTDRLVSYQQLGLPFCHCIPSVVVNYRSSFVLIPAPVLFISTAVDS